MKSWNATIQINAAEQHFSVMLFYVVQGDSYVWVCGWNPEMKVTEQYLSVGLIILHKVVLTFESVWMKATEQYFSVNFWVCGWNPEVQPFK